MVSVAVVSRPTVAATGTAATNPTTVAELNEGETVLDLVSGGGIDAVERQAGRAHR
jgi:hypothetical protein